MEIRFQFDPIKAVHVMAYFVDHAGVMDKAKLFKLLYLADRKHYIDHGHPITGDRQVAMKHGPLPSGCLDLLHGLILGSVDPFEVLEVNGKTVRLAHRPEQYLLDEAEFATLEHVCNEHSHKTTWDLVEETHEYPEYKEAYRENTSTTISYELIARHHGGPDRYRHGRAVISADAASRMKSPFPGPEPDL